MGFCKRLMSGVLFVQAPVLQKTLRDVNKHLTIAGSPCVSPIHGHPDSNLKILKFFGLEETGLRICVHFKVAMGSR